MRNCGEVPPRAPIEKGGGPPYPPHRPDCPGVRRTLEDIHPRYRIGDFLSTRGRVSILSVRRPSWVYGLPSDSLQWARKNDGAAGGVWAWFHGDSPYRGTLASPQSNGP